MGAGHTFSSSKALSWGDSSIESHQNPDDRDGDGFQNISLFVLPADMADYPRRFRGILTMQNLY